MSNMTSRSRSRNDDVPGANRGWCCAADRFGATTRRLIERRGAFWCRREGDVAISRIVTVRRARRGRDVREAVREADRGVDRLVDREFERVALVGRRFAGAVARRVVAVRATFGAVRRSGRGGGVRRLMAPRS
jgi:hypothetical protein